MSTRPDISTFRHAAGTANLIPMYRRIFSDQLTPVLAYRRLVAEDEREAPSFLFESVEQGARLGRYSMLGTQPIVEIVAKGSQTQVITRSPSSEMNCTEAPAPSTAVPGGEGSKTPFDLMRAMADQWKPATAIDGLPESFTGGWVGYAGYDTVRYAEPDKLPFADAPADDRNLPDLHFGLYREVVVFDHVRKVVFAIHWVCPGEHESLDAAWHYGQHALDQLVSRLQTHSVPLPAGSIDLTLRAAGTAPVCHTLTRDHFEQAVVQAQEYIKAGDIFQVVLSQRFERETTADPFEIYRALRIVNPSPYMIYLQAQGTILVASSPEILCRVHGHTVVNRPLAGTRKRGSTAEEDASLERELLADEKERAEHIMLVDLGRNDVGKVAESGTVSIVKNMEIERYSHVMHISSTVTGQLASGKSCWDALQAALPVGTISGAPKVRAMQIVDELEPIRRGPYGGGIGAVSFHGEMDIALALRTMVIPTGAHADTWNVHIQAGAGIVFDSVPAGEYQETVNKAAALNRAIDLAERAFRSDADDTD
ncbi:MAG: anthranilate synthase component I [Planctomycetes bacterium]|nr:anthranilate synthase component I [Planctomycetota bacterium]NOG53368.1 anthranilate synthase component I [Planctomycetota bacterium]